MLVSACAPRAASTATPEQPADTLAPTFTPLPSNTATPLPAPTEVVFTGAAFTFQTIPLGETHEFTVEGSDLAVTITDVLSGQEAADVLQTNSPPGMSWLIIQLSLALTGGEADMPVQPLTEDMFSIVTRGQVDPTAPVVQAAPAPSIAEVNLLPGEGGSARLARLVYRDDPAPILRFTTPDSEVFFALTDNGDVVLEPEVDFIPQNEIFTEESPLPMGDAMFAARSGDVFKLQVQDVLRGARAGTMMREVFGVQDEPPAGLEYALAFLSVKVARSDQKVVEIGSDLFSSLSQGEEHASPALAPCPMPCFQGALLYPNGTASGWLPLLVRTGDAEALLIFDGFVFMSLAGDERSEFTYAPPSGVDVFGYETRDHISSVLSLSQPGPIYSVAFSPDGRLLVSGGDDRRVRVWDAQNGDEIATLQGPSIRVRQIDFSPDGSLLAAISASNELFIWDTASWQVIFSYDGEGNGLAVRFLPDDKLVSVRSDGVITLWDLLSFTTIRDEGIPVIMDPACRNTVVFSFDTDAAGDVYAASLSCGYAVLWNPGEDRALYIDNSQQVDLPRVRYKPKSSSVSLSPDGKIANYGMVYYPDLYLMTMDVIDVVNQTRIAALSPMDPHLMASAIAPNNDVMFAGVGNKMTFWWHRSGRYDVNFFHQRDGHAGLITDIAISQDGRQMASADYSGKILVWRVIP